MFVRFVFPIQIELPLKEVDILLLFCVVCYLYLPETGFTAQSVYVITIVS